MHERIGFYSLKYNERVWKSVNSVGKKKIKRAERCVLCSEKVEKTSSGF